MFWLVGELGHKYTRSLIFGLAVGFFATVALARAYPTLLKRWFTPTDRIGIVGEFTPTTLPLSVQNLISYGLTSVDVTGYPQPALASSWEATDSGRVFIFELKRDYLWHNDKPVEAKDVNYNIRNVTFTDEGPHRLKATLLSPYSPFPSLVAKPIFRPGLIGFGPYKVDAISLRGDTVSFLRLVPVTDPKDRTLEYRFYRTEQLAILGYKLGEIDRIEDLSTIEPLKSWENTRVVEQSRYNRIVSLFFNLNNPLLKEKSVRQGLAYAVPKLEFERAYSPLAKKSWAYSDNVRRYIFDPSQAEKLLADIKEGTQSAELTITTFPQYLDVAKIIADSWNTLGIKTQVKVEGALSSGFEVLLSAQDVPPDPDQYPFWHSTQTQTNVSGYVNVKIDKLLEDGRQELDIANREKIYVDFQRRLVDDAPVVFLYYPNSYTVLRGSR